MQKLPQTIVQLNLSHNFLQNSLDELASLSNLTSLDVSFNEIKAIFSSGIADGPRFASIKFLDLSHNKISRLISLDKCLCLQK